jgi:hypothetical protein
MSAWIKSTNVTGGSGPMIVAFGPDDVRIASDGQRGHRPVIGTRDWQQYTAFADIPPQTKTLYWGVTFNGHGKLWIDEDSVQVDLADQTPPPDDAPGN